MGARNSLRKTGAILNRRIMKLVSTPILTTETATWHARIPEGAQDIQAHWHGQTIAVSYTIHGKRSGGYVHGPKSTQTPAQFAALKRKLGI